MADADLQDSVPLPGSDPLSQPDNTLSNQDEFHAEHEAGDAESLEHAADTPVNHDAISEDVDVIADAPQPAGAEEAGHHEAPDPALPGKPKSGLTVKPPQGKMSSAPPTPLVKKIINSGTFGSGAVKPPPRSSVPAATTKPAAAPLLKKSSSASAAPKPTIVSSRTLTSTAPPSRRSSVVPPKTANSIATKPSAPPTASKPALATATSAPARQSVVSPSGSVASLKSGVAAHRPRASVSEGIKRATPTGTKPATSAPTKAATATTKAAPSRSSAVGAGTKAAGPSGSISSVHEIKGGKDSEELRNKLKDATEELASRAQVASELENRIQQLQTLLAEAQVEIQAKSSSVQQLEHAKMDLEVKYQGELDASNKQSDELSSTTAAQLAAADEKVAGLQSAVQAKEELIESLSSQRSALEGELLVATEKLEAARNAQASASQAEREAVLKAEADLKATIAEIEALKLAHTQATETTTSKTRDLERSASRIEELETQINNLKTEREENASKVSELEVEILELRESQETLEDDRETVLAKVKSLEEQIYSLVSAAKQAEEAARSKATEFEARVADLHSKHAEQVQNAADEHATIVATLETVQARLEAAQREYEQGQKDAEAAAQGHLQKLKEAEGSFLKQKTQLEEEIKRLTAELEGQEAKYNSRLDAVKAEHEVLLQDTFKRAKIEAGEEHAVELQNLRASSNSTIEQLQSANQVRTEDLKREHSMTLESELKVLDKQINSLNLELKATTDDLSKAKASLDAARSEVESLTKQRDEALTAAATPKTSPEHLEAIARLTSELSRSKDDLHAVTDMLNLTKASLSEMSRNHEKELEEAAKSRAEEATKLRTVHDEDIATFAAQKSELSIKLSDLEGELATLKASMSSDRPKSNGVSAPHPPSPDSTGVTREELQHIHEAHNLKMYDLQAEHDRAVKALQEELKASHAKAEELQEEVSRKTMEIQYLEQDQEENQEQITRLREDLEQQQQPNN